MVGETPNLAAPACRLFPKPGAVVIASSTHRSYGPPVETPPISALPRQGLRRGHPGLAGASRGRGRRPVRGTARTQYAALVGRDEEIEPRARRRWAETKEGEGCVVSASGEPGIGANCNLVHTLLERVSGGPARDISVHRIIKTARSTRLSRTLERASRISPLRIRRSKSSPNSRRCSRSGPTTSAEAAPLLADSPGIP